MAKFRHVFGATLCLATVSMSAFAGAQVFDTSAPHAVIIDGETGIVLFEKDARVPMAPASMTKIMTTEMVFGAIKSGRLSLSDEFSVSEEAWRRGGVKSGSSTMFLKVGSTASVEDLLRGVIIQSGNDACIVLAEGMAGSEDAFATQMTNRAREMGLTSATFKNATGWPHPEHKISALDLAKLGQHLIATYPEFHPIYSEPNFTWNGIKQGNRNPLLGKVTGADGLKTGHTEASGYGLVGSALRDGKRRIIVINGLGSKQERADVSRSLMQAAFSQFSIAKVLDAGTELGRAEVYMGKAPNVGVAIAAPMHIGLHSSESGTVTSEISYKTAVAPIEVGQEIGELVVRVNGEVRKTVPVIATNAVAQKSFFGKAWASLLQKIRG